MKRLGSFNKSAIFYDRELSDDTIICLSWKTIKTLAMDENNAQLEAFFVSTPASKLTDSYRTRSMRKTGTYCSDCRQPRKRLVTSSLPSKVANKSNMRKSAKRRGKYRSMNEWKRQARQL